MRARYAEWRPDSVLARCIRCGAGAGALIGLVVPLGLLVLGLEAYGGTFGLAGLEVLPFALMLALGTGGVIGLACGLVAFLPLVVAAEADREYGVSPAGRRLLPVRPGRASLCAGGGAALLPATFAAAEWAHQAMGWVDVCCFIGTFALFGGLLLGPHVMYGPARTGSRKARAGRGPRLGR